MKKVKQLSAVEISSFCSQMSLILNAGIPTIDGLVILQSDTKDASGKELCASLIESIEKGSNFSKALELSGVFPFYALHMVKIGEEAGSLDIVLKSLAEYYEREENITVSVKNATRYPLIMIVMMVVIIAVLLTKVLPIFNRVFEQLGTQITGVAGGLLHLGESMNQYSFVIVSILVLFTLLILFFVKIPLGKKISSSFLQWFPPTKNFYYGIAMSRFAGGISLTLKSGLDTYKSLDLVYDLSNNRRVREKILICRNALSTGSNFSEALLAAGLFSNLHARMISIGFKTGSIDSVMSKISNDYEIETDNRIYSVLSMLEPTLVIVLSIIVGFILLSVILPLMGIMSSIG